MTGDGKKNFLINDAKTQRKDIEEKFHELTGRKDLAMVLITQDCADIIRNDSLAGRGKDAASLLGPIKTRPLQSV